MANIKNIRNELLVLLVSFRADDAVHILSVGVGATGKLRTQHFGRQKRRLIVSPGRRRRALGSPVQAYVTAAFMQHGSRRITTFSVCVCGNEKSAVFQPPAIRTRHQSRDHEDR